MQLQTVLGYSFIYDMIFIAVFKNKHNYYKPSISTPLPSEKLCMRTFILFPSVIATLSPWCVGVYKTEHVISNICRIWTTMELQCESQERQQSFLFTRVFRQALKSTSRTHPTSYLIGKRGAFSRSNMASEWSCPLTSIQHRG